MKIDETSKNGFYEYANNYHERQSGESFKVTNQSRRLICRRGARNCRLRVTRSIELRQRTYGRALQFVQSEQYLSLDDMDLIKYFLFFKLSCSFLILRLVFRLLIRIPTLPFRFPKVYLFNLLLRVKEGVLIFLFSLSNFFLRFTTKINIFRRELSYFIGPRIV